MPLSQWIEELGFSPEWVATVEPYYVRVEGGAPVCLKPDFYDRYGRLMGERAAVLAPAVARVRLAAERSPALGEYIALLMLLAYDTDRAPALGAFPEPVKLLAADAGIPALLAALGALPAIEQRHAALGLPPEHLRGIADWIAGTVEIYAAAHDGRPGHDLRQLYWLRHSIEGRLFRIGRFEFMIEPPATWLPAIYRHRSTGEVIAFCRDRWRLDREGFLAGAGEPCVHCCRLETVDGKLSGTPIDFTTGRAEAGKLLTVAAADYEAVIAAHDWVPGVHIPGGGGMTPEVTLPSFQAARKFFRTYFRKEIKVFCCESWILNPDWLTELPESNLAKFMRSLRLFPVPPSPKSGLFFVFGRDGEADWRDYPADNSLRRAFHRIRESGRPLRAGGMFYLMEER